MLAASHILVGGAIGGRVKSPYAALPIAFASHFVLDAVPHVDAVTLFGFGGPRSDLAIAADAMMGAVLLLALAWRQARMRWILWCGLAAIIMDVMVMFPLWFPGTGSWPVLCQLCRLHGAIARMNPDTSLVLGLATQAPALILPFFLLHCRHPRLDS